MSTLEERIAAMVLMVERNERSISVLSTGEQIAVALVLDRQDLLKGSGYRTMLAAVDRLEASWLSACLRVQRQGWQRV